MGERGKMKKCLQISFLVLFVMMGMTACGSPEVGNGSVAYNNQQRGIWVNGQGSVEITPDVAVITLGVQAQGKNVATAQTEATDAMNKVIAAMKSEGIASNDIQTHRFSIQVVTSYDSSAQRDVVIGYLVTNVVTAKIRILDAVGSVIDSVAIAGGDFTRIENLSFSIDDPTQYYKEAREKAFIDAIEKAQQIAKLSVIGLGKPTFISESISQPSLVPIKAGTSGGTPISPGELEIKVNVQLVYDISK